jgi:Growth-Arrest-Specific Protein 2 Domain
LSLTYIFYFVCKKGYTIIIYVYTMMIQCVFKHNNSFSFFLMLNLTTFFLCLCLKVRDLVEKCTCASQFPIIRVSEGKYRIGDTKVLIFVRVSCKNIYVFLIIVSSHWLLGLCAMTAEKKNAINHRKFYFTFEREKKIEMKCSIQCMCNKNAQETILKISITMIQYLRRRFYKVHEIFIYFFSYFFFFLKAQCHIWNVYSLHRFYFIWLLYAPLKFDSL